jgi:hypothetical protein
MLRNQKKQKLDTAPVENAKESKETEAGHCACGNAEESKKQKLDTAPVEMLKNQRNRCEDAEGFAVRKLKLGNCLHVISLAGN